MEKYPAKQHARKVVKKLGVPNGLIYLPGTPTRNNEDSDMPAPFRQRRYFYYISGCNEPGCHVVYDIQNDKLILFIPRIDPARVIWTGRGSTPAEALSKYDIDSVFYADQRVEFIAKWLNHYKGNIYILHPEQNPLAAEAQETPEIDFTSLQPAMDHARVIKDEYEIKLIKKANDISSRAHKAVLANILRFKNEAQVEGLFLNVCISHQAKEQAYAPIVASGPNAGTLHYDSNNQDFGDRQLLCLDAGCEWQLYASDVTRTLPLSGNWPSKESEEIYRLVERMQEACISRMAPGTRFLDLHVLAHQIAIDGLLGLGILHNGTSEEIYNAGTSRAFFPHGLGHHVGLEVHDVGHAELISASNEVKVVNTKNIYPESLHAAVYDEALCMAPATPQSGHLEPGMVVTVEPGIYFSTYALNMFYLPSPIHSKYINVSVLEKYLPVGGVRIEDDILVTSNGYENLTMAPKGDAMMEIIRTQGANLRGIRQSPSLTMPKGKARAAEDLVHGRDQPLLRAPGIPEHMSGTQGIKRATTLPIRSVSPPSSVCHMMFIPVGALGLLIGPRGETIRRIQDLTGVNIIIPGLKEHHAEGTCPLTLQGHPNSMHKAVRFIKDIVNRLEMSGGAQWNDRQDILNATSGSVVDTPEFEQSLRNTPKNPRNEERLRSCMRHPGPAVFDKTIHWHTSPVDDEGVPRGIPFLTQVIPKPQMFLDSEKCVDVKNKKLQGKEPISLVKSSSPCAEKWQTSKPERKCNSVNCSFQVSQEHPELAKTRQHDHVSQTQPVQQAASERAQSQAMAPALTGQATLHGYRSHFAPISRKDRHEFEPYTLASLQGQRGTDLRNMQPRPLAAQNQACPPNAYPSLPSPKLNTEPAPALSPTMAIRQHVSGFAPPNTLKDHKSQLKKNRQEVQAVQGPMADLKLRTPNVVSDFGSAHPKAQFVYAPSPSEAPRRLGNGLFSDGSPDYEMQNEIKAQHDKQRRMMAKDKAEQLPHGGYRSPAPPPNPAQNHSPSPTPSSALQDYQMQLMLLEQLNKKRRLLAIHYPEHFPHVECMSPPPPPPPPLNPARNHSPSPTPSGSALQDYQMQLMLLEQQNRKRLLMARQEQESRAIAAHRYHPTTAGPSPPQGIAAPNRSPRAARQGKSLSPEDEEYLETTFG